MTLPPGDLLDIADHAVKSLIRRNGYFVDQLCYEDMVGSAIVRMLEVDTTVITGDVNGYLYRTAYHAAFDWIWWWQFGKSYAYCRYTKPLQLEDINEMDRSFDTYDVVSNLSPEQLATLRSILLSGRIKRGSRGEQAAKRDVQILDLLARGYTNQGICQELGLPYSSVVSYRGRIREALQTYVNMA